MEEEDERERMMRLTCPRCGYETILRSNMRKHLARRTLCKPVLQDIPMEIIQEQLRPVLYKRDAIKKDAKTYPCEACENLFTTRQALSRHRLKYCKGPPEPQPITQEQWNELLKRQSDLAKDNEDLRKKLEAMTTTPVSQTTNHTTNNTTNNNIQINLNAFGKETTSHLTHAFLNRCVRRTNMGLIDLLEKLHFDDQVKSNANVRITNRKMPLAEYNDGQRWRFQNRETLLSAMLDKGHEILQEHLDDHEDELKHHVSETMWNYIVKWFEKVTDRDTATVEKVLTDIFVLILNHSS